jgi:peptide/nickel transport system ATP-binding protein
VADDPVLAVRDLRVTFPGSAGDVRAVRGIDYDLRRGEVLGIVGESGSGKSASATAVTGLLPQHAHIEGSIKLDGQELVGLDDAGMANIRGKRIAMVFQDPLSALTPVYTVGDQLVEAVRVHNDVSKEAALQRSIDLLKLVGIPHADERVKAFPHEFSGGMRQRVMIAMAIANDPDVIIADEPTTALDVTIQAQVLEVLRTAREVTGAAIVMITHDLSVIAGFADRVAVMYAGRIVETGTVDEVFYSPRMPYTMGLLGAIPRADDPGDRPLVPIEGSPPSLVSLPAGCPFAPRCPLVFDTCREVEPALIPVGSPGHRSACHLAEKIEAGGWGPADVYPLPDVPEAPMTRVPREEREVVLEAKDLVRHHPLMKGAVFKRQVGSVRAVDGISFDVRDGEVLALVGESGCGKTTTLLEVLELAAPQSGRIVVLGRDVAELGDGERRAMRRNVNIVFQDPLASLDPRLPVSDIIAEPMRTHGMNGDKIGARIRELLRLVGLNPEHASRYPQQFSGGQRQRIGIARALALEPELLVLDEPVSALDVSIQAGVINLLEELRARLGLSYLFVAHDLAVVRHIADRIAVMYLGKIVEIGDVKLVYETPSHPYTQALLSAIPLPDPHKERARRRIILEGDLPSPADPPTGCRFRTRCPKFAGLDEDRRRRCLEEEPPLYGMQNDHSAACHYAEALKVV